MPVRFKFYAVKIVSRLSKYPLRWPGGAHPNGFWFLAIFKNVPNASFGKIFRNLKLECSWPDEKDAFQYLCATHIVFKIYIPEHL